ncbi:hypothetical protein [Paludibacterium sp.]|uniref:gp53-like domain-containing protein n=1 Tax=Paludibacterium sp. TaxID=1917523 RepID=UPI0025F262C9|nr:hypothetical protein [Paludibacterium sp.]MBV8649616.1 hypothetical protein [Paludibacterium sp.]
MNKIILAALLIFISAPAMAGQVFPPQNVDQCQDGDTLTLHKDSVTNDLSVQCVHTDMSLTNPGWISLAGGLTLQWGQSAGCGVQNCGVTYAKPFSKYVIAVLASGNNSGISSTCAATYNTTSLTNFAVALCTVQSFFWFAIGV